MPINDKIPQPLHDNDETITSLNLYCNQAGAEDAKAIAELLDKNTILTSLYLNSNQLRDEGVQMLAEILEKDINQTSLDLSANEIRDAGVKRLARILEKNTTLISLDLGENQIGSEGAKELAGVLEMNTTLTTLSLYYNRIGNTGARELAGVLEKNITLTSLDLRYNQIGMGTITQIDSLIKRNQEYLKSIKQAACQQLKVGRVLLFKPRATGQANNLLLMLPLEIREKIVAHVDENALITEEQQRLILNYAEGKIASVADKLSFFKVTKCDRVMKQLDVGSQSGEPPSKKACMGLSRGSEHS